MWHDAIYDLTPVEPVGDAWFKRDDLFSPDGVHNGSKFRQLIWLFSRGQFPGVVSGAVTGSPQLPMVAACAKHYGMKCVQFTGALKNMAVAGEKLGAETILVNPGYGPLLNSRARDYAAAHGWLRIETNITVTTSDADIEAFHRVGSEQVRNLPDHVETLIIPAGSRNSAVSILYGLHRAYKNVVMHPRYEGKCWNYINDYPETFRPYLNDKTLFWIVGSEPSFAQSTPTLRKPGSTVQGAVAPMVAR